ncbi:histone deacetylase superfamily protein [Nitzschia inconspicua]|uniref:Histone deacetylase superfamily protein n=1 Tax=Nitzschia inconspicua TaxID=303405 RepID=A0A9K3KEE7_9STRA|nr:histone deacetylase superfamily protein [Nitzschia inconspicua]
MYLPHHRHLLLQIPLLPAITYIDASNIIRNNRNVSQRVSRHCKNGNNNKNNKNKIGKNRLPTTIATTNNCTTNDSFGISSFQLIDVAPTKTKSTTTTIVHNPFSQRQLDHAQDVLQQIHTPDLVTELQSKCDQSRQRRIEQGKQDPLGFIGYIDDDTYVTTETYNVCLRATATWIQATTTTTTTKHIVVVIVVLQSVLWSWSCRHLDWDVHYGQGIADIIQRYHHHHHHPPPNVRYASIHQVPAFPYQGGTKQEITNNDTTLTIPIPAETTWTCGYRDKFQIALDFLFGSNDDVHETFRPTLVIICAGYDALDSDELASVSLTANDYGQMTQMVLERIQQQQQRNMDGTTCGLLLGLEGGYQLRPQAATASGGSGNMPDAIVKTVQAILQQSSQQQHKQQQQQQKLH